MTTLCDEICTGASPAAGEVKNPAKTAGKWFGRVVYVIVDALDVLRKEIVSLYKSVKAIQSLVLLTKFLCGGLSAALERFSDDLKNAYQILYFPLFLGKVHAELEVDKNGVRKLSKKDYRLQIQNTTLAINKGSDSLGVISKWVPQFGAKCAAFDARFLGGIGAKFGSTRVGSWVASQGFKGISGWALTIACVASLSYKSGTLYAQLNAGSIDRWAVAKDVLTMIGDVAKLYCVWCFSLTWTGIAMSMALSTSSLSKILLGHYKPYITGEKESFWPSALK